MSLLGWYTLYSGCYAFSAVQCVAKRITDRFLLQQTCVKMMSIKFRLSNFKLVHNLINIPLTILKIQGFSPKTKEEKFGCIYTACVVLVSTGVIIQEMYEFGALKSIPSIVVSFLTRPVSCK